MINPATLSERLAGLIGFRQPFNPTYAVIDAENLASRSGLYITDNPFVKIEAIKDTQDYKDISDESFNTFLRNKVATSVVNVANAVFNEVDYIDRQLMYKNALNKFSLTAPDNVNTYDLPPGFSCYWIQVSKKQNIAFKIERVFLEFAGTGDITLYLYNTADLQTPLYSKVVTVDSPLKEVKLDWICDNTGTGNGYKGDYYLGYFSNGLTLKPFKREYRDAVVTSIISQLTYYRSNFATFTQPSDVFDLMSFTPYVYYNGINPDITVYEDYTDFITQNEKLFARAIMLDCQIAMLSETVASMRSNSTQRISSAYISQMQAEIEGQSGEGIAKVQGLRPQFFGAIGTIRKEIKKLKQGTSSEWDIVIETVS